MFSTFTRKTPRTSTLLATGGALAVLLLSGCGSSSHAGHTASGTSTTAPSSSTSYGPAASGPHNPADVAFATNMLLHHAQAVEMADLALSRDTNAQVKALAQQIKGAQAPEIASMSGWLVGWGEPVPTLDSHASGSGHDMAGMGTSMNGMMSDAEMSALDAASGTEFAKQWLTGMVTHHAGAVTMAKTELASGQNSEAKTLASSIAASQSTEIASMSKLLATLA